MPWAIFPSMNDIVTNKVQTIHRCLHQIGVYFGGRPERLEDQQVEDAVVLNLQRACEAAIDLANHIVSLKKLGVPQNSRDSFELLAAHNLLTPLVCDQMKRMIGFRNIAIHDYQRIERPIVLSILTKHLGDFQSFVTEAQAALS